MASNKWLIRGLSVLLAFVLCGGPEVAQAWQQQTSPGNTPVLQQPANDAQQPPDAPAPQPQKQEQQKKKDQAPLGAAAAQKGPTAGGAASRPAGNAIAPAHQRQVRSLLIKIGAIAAAGAAFGAVYALTRGTPSTPPMH
ncbi:MAG TPA: hypothetical protein VFU76_01635 [Terriglobales bacterium]|nr:hypothetical protein [Terriglobales bacterium]